MRYDEVCTRGIGATRCQPPGKPVRPGGRTPHGVQSAPKTDTGIVIGTWEPHSCFFLPSAMKMIEATDDRANEGWSSQRAGKPSTSAFCKEWAKAGSGYKL